MDYFNKVKEFVDSKFKEVNRADHLDHLKRTVHWVKVLKPNTSQDLKIAAYAHDIQHAERWKGSKEEKSGKPRKVDFRDKERMKKHEREGAEIIGKFLKDLEAPEELINEVKNLVANHEEGGNKKQDILKDADSISFLERKVDDFLSRSGSEIRKEDVRDKFDYMFERITLKKAEKLARPWYQEAIKKLEKK